MKSGVVNKRTFEALLCLQGFDAALPDCLSNCFSLRFTENRKLSGFL